MQGCSGRSWIKHVQYIRQGPGTRTQYARSPRMTGTHRGLVKRLTGPVKLYTAQGVLFITKTKSEQGEFYEWK